MNGENIIGYDRRAATEGRPYKNITITVIPARERRGTGDKDVRPQRQWHWIPAFAGMTSVKNGCYTLFGTLTVMNRRGGPLWPPVYPLAHHYH